MRLQISHNSYSCLLVSMAMCLDVQQEELIVEIGHDGSEMWWPGLKEPYCRRGFHIQELIDCAWHRGQVILELLAQPLSVPCAGVTPRVTPTEDDRFADYLDGRVAVLGCTLVSGVGHAVAWDGHLVYDPRGNVCSADTFDCKIHTAYLVLKSNG